MMKRHILIFVICIATSVSCTKEDGLRERISLKAHVIPAVSTKAAVSANPYEGTDPTDKQLDAAIWFSQNANDFDHNPASPTYIPCRTSISYTDNQATYVSYEGNYLKYPTDNSNVYCIGFYPNTLWESADGVNITRSITGSEDLMFADVIEGDWNNRFDHQQYEHLLTWIKISVCAMTQKTADHWGKIKKISLSSKRQVKINLSEAKGSSHRITYLNDNQENTDQYITAYDDAEGLTLSLNSKDAGSLLCSPAKSYHAIIETEKGGTKEVTVDLVDLNYNKLTDDMQAKGKLFILSLYFTPFNIIEGTCTLNYWNDQNEDLYLQ